MLLYWRKGFDSFSLPENIKYRYKIIDIGNTIL